MTRTLATALAACIGLALLQPVLAQPGAGTDAPAIATAGALLDRLEAGDFEAATADFNAQMRSALGPDRLEAVQRQIDAAGELRSRGEPRVSRRDGLTVVVVRIERAHAALDATIAIDGEGRVAGLHFTPAAGDAR